MSNIHEVNVTDENLYLELWQYDAGQRLKFVETSIADGSHVLFANSETRKAIRKEVVNNEVGIPNKFLRATGKMHITIETFNENEETTLYEINGYIKRRQDGEPGTSPEDEPTFIQKIIQKTIELAQSVRDDADAGEFDGYSPQVTVKTETPSTYVLHIKDADHEFDTPNLQGQGGGGSIEVGDGLKREGNVVSVDNGNHLYFSNGKLTVGTNSLGTSDLRSVLANTSLVSTYKPLATREYVDNLISTSLKRLVVEQLPQNPNTYTIYMILRSAPTTNNIYDEYMYINNAWELIGSTEVDLSNYYTKTESDTKYQNKIDSTHKLDADNVDDSESTNKFVTEREKASIRPIVDTAKGSTISLTDSADSPLDAISIMGKSTQNGTPTIDSPIPIVDITQEEVEITDGTDTQSAELTKTLRGIPVASGGNYTDSNNQQWICDTIERYKDGSGKYIQRVGTKTLNGTENWYHEVLSNNRHNFYTLINDAKKGNFNELLCNMAIHSSIISDGTVLVSNSGNLNFCINAYTDTTSFKNFLSSNNLVIVYQLITQTETPLTSEELAELDLDTYYPSTTITANTDVVVEYVVDVKTALSTKQDKLTAGTNITIDSNNVISASGGGLSYTFTDGLTESSGTVSLDLKSGTELQITNGELDIDLSSYATTTDLSSKQDTIDSTHKLSADLVDDTNSTNKFVSATEKQTWNAKADTSDIPTNVSELTNDSGYQTSSDVQTAIADKEDNTTITTDTTSTTVSLTLADNNEYRYTQDLTSLTLTMPNGDFIASVVFASGSTPTSMTYDSSIKWSGNDVSSNAFVPQANMEYEIVFWYNGLSVNAVVRGVA